MRALAPEATAQLRTELAESVAHLRSLLTLGDPLYIASIVQLSNLLTGWGTYFEPTFEGSEPKVELVAGLLATQPASRQLDGPSDADLQKIHDAIDRVLEIQLPFNLSMIRKDDDETSLRFMGAMGWMTLRGSSYAHHGRDLARAIYRPHDEWTLATFGFTIDDVLAVGEAAEALMSDRFNALKDKALEFSAAVLKELGSRQKSRQLPTEIEAQLASDEGKLQIRGRALVDILQPGLRAAMTFTVDEICEGDVGLRRERVEAVLSELSIKVGSLRQSDYTGLFDKSPFVERPYLEFDRRYLLVIPGMVLRDPIALLEHRLITGKAGFSQARAKSLDALAVKYLSNILPASRTYTNLFYDGGELDGLVLFDDLAVLVEGKGGALSVPARRGDLKRLRSEIKDSIQEAWTQASRARTFISQGGDAVFRDEQGVEVRIAAGSVREFVIVNPTIHELGGHAPQLGRLRALDLFSDDELPWSVFVNDLRVITETADNAAVFLHYVVWRNRLPLGQRVTVSDEIDLWGCYLNCERFGMLAVGDAVLIANSSTDFDAYYNGLVGDGPKRKIPGKFLHEPVRAFVEKMASARPEGWRDAAGACLDLSIPELALVRKTAAEVAHRAKREQQTVWETVGRVALVGIPPAIDVSAAIAQPQAPDSDPTLVIYLRERTAKRAEIVWAKCAKAVTFELSTFEKAAFNAVYPASTPQWQN